MNRFYEKNELTFSLIWIAAYVILCSLSDSFSASLGIRKIITAPLCLVFVLFLLYWIHKSHLSEKYGLCAFKGDLKKYLYFIPLILLVTCNLWNGVTLNLSPLETTLYIFSMLCVGLIEEVLFRGFLFKALSQKNLNQAIIISSITFGIGHIVNLLNGAEVFSTLLQICYAVAIGFLFTVIFQKGKSLFPCIIAHGIFNSLSAFAVDGSQISDIVTAILLSAVSVGYAVWIWKKSRIRSS